MKFVWRTSRKILERKNENLNKESIKSPEKEFETETLASAMKETRTPSAHNKRVVSDFLSLPSSPPKQLNPENSEREDELLESYKEEIYQMAIQKESLAKYNELNTLDSQYQKAMGSSLSNIVQYSKIQWSENQNKADIFKNGLNNPNFIEKNFNGNTEDNDNSPSIGSQSFGIQDSYLKEGQLSPNISDPLIDPFFHRFEKFLRVCFIQNYFQNFYNFLKNFSILSLFKTVV